MTLSKNFTLEEMTVSQEASRSGLPNKPNAEHVANLAALCEHVLQPLRDHLGRAVVISSGFRSPAVNRRVGGSFSSQHTRGQAADFIIPGMSVAEVIVTIHTLNLPVDQCIDEFGAWIHVSHTGAPRDQYLKARRSGGRTFYQPLILGERHAGI